jgi:hypothetical protein
LTNPDDGKRVGERESGCPEIRDIRIKRERERERDT